MYDSETLRRSYPWVISLSIQASSLQSADEETVYKPEIKASITWNW